MFPAKRTCADCGLPGGGPPGLRCSRQDGSVSAVLPAERIRVGCGVPGRTGPRRRASCRGRAGAAARSWRRARHALVCFSPLSTGIRCAGAGDWLSGRAPRSHRGGHWFDPSIAHQKQQVRGSGNKIENEARSFGGHLGGHLDARWLVARSSILIMRAPTAGTAITVGAPAAGAAS
jgi:hypothetical protein